MIERPDRPPCPQCPVCQDIGRIRAAITGEWLPCLFCPAGEAETADQNHAQSLPRHALHLEMREWGDRELAHAVCECGWSGPWRWLRTIAWSDEAA